MTPRDGGPTAPDESGMLTVLVGAGAGEPERLYMIGRPAGGRVRVREWSTATWNQPAQEREMAVSELWSALERAHGARRRLSEELPRIRHWLDGRDA